MNKKFYLIITLLLFVIGATASPISENEARAIAGKFCNSNSTMRKAPGKNDALKLAAATKGYYAFNCGEQAGYVIVAANDEASAEVLGYSDSGAFDVDNMPENMKWWLGEYTRQIEYAAANPTANKSKANAASVARANIAPLLTCRWNQDEPYNDMCPVVGGMKSVTGCVATAMAQIMYHHQWPEKGVGSHSYYYGINWSNGKQETVSPQADFSSTTYNWNAMTDDYNQTSSKESCDAVANLMYHAGVSVDMRYYGSSSAATSSKVAEALSTYFKYDKSAICIERNFYSINEWEDIIYSNLKSKQPILYGGASNYGSHAFVCDGYKDGYFHINWGWGGMSDGYFMLTALNPESQGYGGSGDGYNFEQDAVINICKDKGGDYTPLMYCTSRYDITPKETTRNAYISISVSEQYNGLFCKSVFAREYAIGLKFVNKNGDVEYVAKTGPFNLNPNTGYSMLHLYLSDVPEEDGEYIVSPAFYDVATGEWYEMRTNITKGSGKFIATVTGKNISFTEKEADASEISVEEIAITSEKIFTGGTLTAKATIKNTGAEYYGYIQAGVTNQGQNNLITSSGSTLIDIVNEGTVDLTVPVPNTAGKYDLVILDGNNNILKRETFVAKDAPNGYLNIEICSLEMDNADYTDRKNVKLTAKIKCNSGYYIGEVKAPMFKNDEGSTSIFLTGKVGIEAGETKTIELTGACNNGYPGDHYIIQSLMFSNILIYYSNIKFTIANEVEKTISNMGYASFSSASTLTVPEGVDVYKAKVKEMSGNTVILLTKVNATVIPANTGVVLYSEEPGTKRFVETAPVYNIPDYENNYLIATSVEANATVPATGTYYALKADAPEFARVASGLTLSSDKAYIAAPSANAKTLSIVIDDGTDITGINSIYAENDSDNGFYTLQGIKVAAPGKGIYIKNGKKVLFK